MRPIGGWVRPVGGRQPTFVVPPLREVTLRSGRRAVLDGGLLFALVAPVDFAVSTGEHSLELLRDESAAVLAFGHGYVSERTTIHFWGQFGRLQ